MLVYEKRSNLIKLMQLF